MDRNPHCPPDQASDRAASVKTESALWSTAWLTVALLWPVALLNYLDRQMLAAMKFSVMVDIPSIADDANWGYMLGQFKWVYAVLSPLGGYLADRFSRRYTICASLFVWSAVTWITGHVTTYDALLWTRTFMGISEAFYIPAALALIADFHAARTRSRAVGIHQMAIYTGIIIGGFSGYVAESPDLGWRFAFDLTGIAGVIYAVPLLLLLRDAPDATLTRLPENRSGKGDSPILLGGTRKIGTVPDGFRRLSVVDSLRLLLTNGSFLLLVACFALPALAGWIVKDWMPAILKDQFDIGQGKAGVSATLYVNLASFGGALLGGWLADRWLRHTQRARIYVSALGISLLIPALFGVGNAGTLAAAIVFLIVFGIGWGFFDCNNMPILAQIATPELRATGYGLMNLVSISCGGFADWGFGALRDRDVPLNLIFGAFAVPALMSVALMLLIRPRIDEPPEDDESVELASHALGRPLLIAHRGYSVVAPENTLPAFLAAVPLGVDVVEFDVQVTADGQLVVFHDDDLARTTDAVARWGNTRLKVNERTLAEIQSLDAGRWFAPQFAGTRVATLDEALAALVPQVAVMVERKSGSAEAVLAALSPYLATGRVTLHAFDWEFLHACRALDSNVVLSALGEGALGPAECQAAIDAGATLLGWEAAALTPQGIAEAHRCGLQVWSWTIDELPLARRLLAAGLDGVITNDPGKLKPVVSVCPT